MNNQTIHFSECILCGGSSLPEFVIAAKTHNVRHRGSFRRLCTACLLKTHPGFFCPICFSVYSSPLPASLSRLCSSCAAIAHSHCAKTPNFKCPSCANPTSFSFFKISDCERITTTQQNGLLSKRVVLTEDLAKQLLCAAQIADLSMGKAVESAFGDVEKKVKEAAFARKRAKEAVERFFDLAERNAKEGGGGGDEFLGGNLFRD